MDLNRVTWQERNNVFFGQFVLTSDMINLSKDKTGAEVSDTEKHSDNAETAENIIVSAEQSGTAVELNEELKAAETPAEESNEDLLNSAGQDQKEPELSDEQKSEEQQPAEESADAAVAEDSSDRADLPQEESDSDNKKDESSDEKLKPSEPSADESQSEVQEESKLCSETDEEADKALSVNEEAQNRPEQDTSESADIKAEQSAADSINEESAAGDVLPAKEDSEQIVQESPEQSEQCDVSAFTAYLNSQYEEINKANQIAEQKLADTERDTQELNRRAAELNYQNSMYKAEPEEKEKAVSAAEHEASLNSPEPISEAQLKDALPADSIYTPAADSSVYEEPAETDFVESPVFYGDPAAELMAAAHQAPYVPYEEDETYINTGMSDDFGENMSDQRLYRQRDTDRFQPPAHVGNGSEADAYKNAPAAGGSEYVNQGSAYDNYYANGQVNMQDQPYRSRAGEPYAGQNAAVSSYAGQNVPAPEPYAAPSYDRQSSSAQRSYDAQFYERERAAAPEPYAQPSYDGQSFSAPRSYDAQSYERERAAAPRPYEQASYDRQGSAAPHPYDRQGSAALRPYDRQDSYAAQHAAAPAYDRQNTYAAQHAAAPAYDRQNTYAAQTDSYREQRAVSQPYNANSQPQRRSSYKNSNFINSRSSGSFREASQENYNNRNTGRKPYVNSNFVAQKMQEPNSYQTQPGRSDPYVFSNGEPAVSRNMPKAESQYFTPNNRPQVLVFGYADQIRQRLSYFDPMISFLQSRGVKVSFNQHDLNMLPAGSVILCYRSCPEFLPDRVLHVLTMYENNKAAIWAELKMILSSDGIKL